MDQAPPSQFGPYTLLREIARGGMGIVYEAQDLAGIRVALKLPRPEFATDPRERARFVQEMRLTASLRHPNVVQVLQGGDERGHLYLAMEYVDGSTLRHEIDRRGRLTPLEVIRIGAQVARGLAAAHEHQPAIVHRDLKPGNILLRSDGVTKVTDFGIAKAFDIGAHATTTPMGTPVYMSPEQLNGELSSPASDIHAIGVVLYEALTGVPPFAPTLSVARLIHAICFDTPAAVSVASGLGAAIVPDLDVLVADCLAKAPGRRPFAANVAARLSAIETQLVGEPQTLLPPRAPAHPQIDTIALVQRLEQRPSSARVIGAIALAVVAIGATGWWLSRSDTPTQSPVQQTTAAQAPADAPAVPTPPQRPPDVRRDLPPRPTPDARKPLAFIPLDGLTLAKGPVGGLVEFCRARRTSERGGDELTCTIGKDAAAASASVPNVGTVTAIEFDVNGFDKHYGLLFESNDRLPITHVLAQLESISGGGNESYEIIKDINIEPTVDGRVEVDFVVEYSERIDDGSGRPGFEMDVRKTLKTSKYL